MLRRYTMPRRTHSARSRLATALVLVSVLGLPLGAVGASLAVNPAVSPPAFADPGFQALWARTDSLVASHSAARSWLWGPAPISGALYEQDNSAPGGKRLVQYFDK